MHSYVYQSYMPPIKEMSSKNVSLNPISIFGFSCTDLVDHSWIFFLKSLISIYCWMHQLHWYGHWVCGCSRQNGRLIKHIDMHERKVFVEVLEVVITMLKVKSSLCVQFATLDYNKYYCENNLIRCLEELWITLLNQHWELISGTTNVHNLSKLRIMKIVCILYIWGLVCMWAIITCAFWLWFSMPLSTILQLIGAQWIQYVCKNHHCDVR